VRERPYIPGLGPADVAPLPTPGFTGAADLTAQHYFVLSRCDGTTTFTNLLLISGLPRSETVALLNRLREVGAFYLPGETPPGATPVAQPPPAPPTQVTIDESILESPCDLSMDQRRAILVKQAMLAHGTYFEALEVPPNVDQRGLKRAYFRVSKDFHPDRFFGKNLGAFQSRLHQVFDLLTKAYEILSDEGRRAEYVRSLGGGEGDLVLSPARRAADLFEKACQIEATGDPRLALGLFASVLALDPAGKYIRRAAEAALRLQELRLAEEYARKAADLDKRDAGAKRILAKALRASGRVDEAVKEMEQASQLDPQNPYIASELDELRSQTRA
jgi:hypothetical protein